MTIRFSQLLALFIFLPFASSAKASNQDPVPANATVIRTLECTARLDGDFGDVKTASFVDFTFKDPSMGWDEYASTISLLVNGHSPIEGRIEAANGNDPQESRDGDPSESDGWGGVSFYPLNANSNGVPLVAVVSSRSNQRDLVQRNYKIAILRADSDDLSRVPPLSKGTLSCKLKN